MKALSQITAMVIDHGLFLPLALKLAESYKRVLYWTPFEKGFPLLNDCIIGDGFENLERVDDIWKFKDETDIWVCPDIQHSGLQLELESQGRAVWGSRRGDSLELSREKFHRILKETGLDVPKFERIVGLTNLSLYLKDKENVYIKISKYRGSLETTHYRNWREDETLLDGWAVKFGPAKELIPFMVFENIEAITEVGGDTYGVDGQWPSLMLHGDEWKDKGYIGAVTKTEDMPDEIKAVLEAFAPILKQERYRNQWSMELRVTENDAYFIDPTCRGGLPSTASQIEVWKNFSEIVLAGAHGELVDPEPAAQFTCECVLTMKSDKHSWGVTEIPDELKQWMKLAACCEIDGRICFPPDDSMGDEIGWMVALGDTIKEVIETMIGYVELLPDGVSANTDSLTQLLKEIAKGEAEGIPFADEVPPPEIVVQTT